MTGSRTIGRAIVADGVSIPYADQGLKTGACVVLVHGLGDSWRSYEPVLRHLADDLRVLAPSLRGHGDADRPDGGYTPADFASDLVALLDQAGIDKAVVAGHSSGAQVVQQFAVTYPQRAAGAVLIGAPGSMRDHPGAADLDQTFSALTDPIEPAFVRDFIAGLFAGPVPAGLLDTLVAEGLKVPARVIRATWAGIREFDLSGELDRIVAPTLIVWGDQDHLPVASRDVQDELLRAIPDSRLAVYTDAGHSPHWEQPARFAADLASFLRGLAA